MIVAITASMARTARSGRWRARSPTLWTGRAIADVRDPVEGEVTEPQATVRFALGNRFLTTF
jgi:hypothetical protein